MKVEVRLESPNQSVSLYAEQRLLSCLGHHERTLAEVTVCVSRVPGGAHRCRIVSRPLRWANVVAEHEDGDVHNAIDQAAERLARAIDTLARPSSRPVDIRELAPLAAGRFSR